MADADLTAQRLHEVLHYNPVTGEFTRIAVARAGRWKPGTPAGSVNKRIGYVTIAVDGTPYYAHRLAWLYVVGEWPHGEIDHINGNRADNRLCNLRDVSRQWNAQNMRAESKTGSGGLLGVSRHYRNGRTKWTAAIKRMGKRRYLGIYDTPEQAHAAYVQAKRELHEGGLL